MLCPRYSVTYDQGNTWALRLRNTREEDGGAYMCQVNTIPILQSIGIVNVVGKKT